MDAERGYRAALSAHPDDVEAWYELGELLFHFGPLRGNPATDARAPLEQALVLDPDHGGALYHLIDIAQMQGEPERALALSDRFLRAASEDVLLTARQWTRAWAARDEGSKARLREDWRRAGVSKEGLPFAWSCALWQRDDLGDAGGLAQLLAGSETAGKRAEGFEDLAVLDLARGRLRAAREKMARAVELAPQGPYRLESLWFDATDFLPISATDLQAARESARNLDVGEDPLRAAQLAFVSGALAVRAADLDAAERAAQQLDRMPPVAESSLAHDFALAIRARAAARSGRDDEALAALDRMRLQVPYRLSGAFVRVAEQHLRARLLEARGRDEDALRLYGVFSFYGRFEPIYFAQSHLRRAAIHDRRGERDEAMGHYRRFVELWRDSDPELQPLVEEAKRRLEQLGSKAGSSARAPGP